MNIVEKSPRQWPNSHIQKLFLSNGQKTHFQKLFSSNFDSEVTVGKALFNWGPLCYIHLTCLRPEGGVGKHHFFSFHICDRAAEDEQVEKNI